MARAIHHHLFKQANIETLVENRLQFNTDNLELNLFETKEKAYEFQLEFSDLSLITMLEGKKIMQLDQKDRFDLMPSESLLLDKYTAMQIDFPDADLEHPTRCMALIISEDEIKGTLSMLNDNVKRYNNSAWTVDSSNLKFQNDYILNSSIQKIIQLASSEHPHKKVLSKLATQELIVNLMQTQAKDVLIKHSKENANTNPLAHAIQYIKDNLSNPIDLEKVAQIAFMSKATFFRHFKHEIGITPNEYILQEKVKIAKQMLLNMRKSVTDVAFSLSFNSVSHFVQLFKKYTGKTPNTFRKSLHS
jgi:AraC family transcriptional regulator